MQEQIKQINEIFFSLNENDINVELVKALIRVIGKIERFHNPVFTENGKSVMDKYEEFQFTGLSPTDYIITGYYKNENGIN